MNVNPVPEASSERPKQSKLNDVIQEAQRLNSYFITVTTRDKSKTENDLIHRIFQNDFSTDDIIQSTKHCLQLSEIKNNFVLKEKKMRKFLTKLIERLF
jgi:hypothetical protein